MPLPSLNDHGELPEGVHQATLDEVIAQFGTGTPQRQGVTARLLHLYNLVKAIDHLERFIILSLCTLMVRRSPDLLNPRSAHSWAAVA
jgi:hypothetical protein